MIIEKDNIKVPEEKKAAVGYLRSAVERDAEDILNAQAKSIMEHCKGNELDLVAIFIDNGASGANFERKGWNSLKDFLALNKGKIDCLFVASADRIGRNPFPATKEIGAIEKNVGI